MDTKNNETSAEDSTSGNGDGPETKRGPGPELMGANTLIGNDVYNIEDENIGNIKEIMLDMHNGRVSYAVLSFKSFLSMGEKLFAVPWNAMKLDTEHKRFVLDIEIDQLKLAPGFDKDHWPKMTDQIWQQEINTNHGTAESGETNGFL